MKTNNCFTFLSLMTRALTGCERIKVEPTVDGYRCVIEDKNALDTEEQYYEILIRGIDEKDI